MPVVVDDHLLLAALSDTHPQALADAIGSEPVFTTGCWYYRLARALTTGSGEGTLSGALSGLSDQAQGLALARIARLPPTVGILSQRVVVPTMAALRLRRPVNMLTAEALAVALITDATILVSVESPLLTTAAAELGVAHTFVT